MKCRSILFLLAFCLTSPLLAADRPNVLFIAVDDLRPELACYGRQHIHSPNIDKLAESGTLFERAFCMVPTCGASRASLMTGIRPAKDRFVNFLTWAQKDAPGITTMNTHFKQNGYTTHSLGKIFHHPQDNAQGWSEPAWRPKGIAWYQRPENQRIHHQRQREGKKQGKKWKGPAWESADVADNVYADGVLAEKAISTLEQLKQQDEPFFLAVGFFKPHLPFIAPQKYWDLYDHDQIQLPENYKIPRGAPDVSIHNSGELRSYAGIPPKGPVSEETARNLIHGYYACVSYTDAQIGKLLAALDEMKLSENTIVVLWGDHGWNLGDHTLWCKHSCYESSLHIPLIVRAPGIKGGTRRTPLIETIDVYPSLCQLAGIPAPAHLKGESFVELMRDPDTKWKGAAVSRFRNGDTIRTDNLRYTEYTFPKGKVRGRMLYDHKTDPLENYNVVRQRPDDRDQLSKQLNALKGRPGDFRRD